VKNNIKKLKDYGHRIINQTKKSYVVCAGGFMTIDCALPTPRELITLLCTEEEKNV
jgi:hypothetical protein